MSEKNVALRAEQERQEFLLNAEQRAKKLFQERSARRGVYLLRNRFE